MRRARTQMAFGMIAVFAMMAQVANSQDLAPAPPAIEGEVVEQAMPPQPMPIAATGSCDAVAGSCDAVSGGCCDYQPGATCCCVEPYRCCCCGHIDCYAPGIHKRKHNGKIKWCRYWTTGDMYPHYAYYPKHHGYYYFRPYNYTNVLEHKAQVVGLGGSHYHPYSVAMFDGIYSDYYKDHPVITPIIIDRSNVPGASELPILEELLLE